MTTRTVRSLALLGAGSMALALPLASQAEGFIEDTKATLNLRNAYFNRNFTNPDNGQGKAEEWTQ
ncbi:OprD family outer membrane porin, partial [Pseudomonas turukhanskensis]|uniref:OprD family outer membrane porin n=1 Tax=Pseudomonas turukhanskensis TaxID=1806536 RepID=UPI0022F31109